MYKTTWHTHYLPSSGAGDPAESLAGVLRLASLLTMEVTIAEMSSAVKGREGETWLSVDPFVESDVVEGLLLAGVAELLG